MLDPFTQIHYAIWRALTEYQPWAAMVPLGRRINAVPGDQSGGVAILDKPTLVKVPPVAGGDAPEVRIVQGSFSDVPGECNSRRSVFDQVFIVQLSTASPLLDETPLNKLKYWTRRALYKSGNNRSDLGLENVVGFTWHVSPERDVAADTGLKVWRAVCPIAVRFYETVEQWNQ